MSIYYLDNMWYEFWYIKLKKIGNVGLIVVILYFNTSAVNFQWEKYFKNEQKLQANFQKFFLFFRGVSSLFVKTWSPLQE